PRGSDIRASSLNGPTSSPSPPNASSLPYPAPFAPEALVARRTISVPVLAPAARSCAAASLLRRAIHTNQPRCRDSFYFDLEWGGANGAGTLTYLPNGRRDCAPVHA